jgi:hypothetical protein
MLHHMSVQSPWQTYDEKQTYDVMAGAGGGSSWSPVASARWRRHWWKWASTGFGVSSGRNASVGTLLFS